MHKYLEDYCVNDDPLQAPGSNPFSQQAHKMADRLLLSKGMGNFTGCMLGNRGPFVLSQSYMLVLQTLSEYTTVKPSIIDFKQTNKPKKEEWVDDYKTQLVAYALAHNEVYGTNIKQGVILMCSKDFLFQTWTLKGEEFELFTEHWLNRVQAYYRLIA